MLRNSLAEAVALGVIEHVSGPHAFLREVRLLSTEGAPLLFKAPNINALEAHVFGPDYHSFKREYLVLLSLGWFHAHASECGFRVADQITNSHLLQGFMGEKETSLAAMSGLGSDIEVVLVAIWCIVEAIVRVRAESNRNHWHMDLIETGQPRHGRQTREVRTVGSAETRRREEVNRVVRG